MEKAINLPEPVENRDQVIQSRRSFLDLCLDELRLYSDLVLHFVRSDFISVYKQTTLGPI